MKLIQKQNIFANETIQQNIEKGKLSNIMSKRGLHPSYFCARIRRKSGKHSRSLNGKAIQAFLHLSPFYESSG